MKRAEVQPSEAQLERRRGTAEKKLLMSSTEFMAFMITSKNIKVFESLQQLFPSAGSSRCSLFASFFFVRKVIKQHRLVKCAEARKEKSFAPIIHVISESF
jgi:hypothetical protein